MPDPAAEFQHLLNQREISLHTLARVVDTIVLFWEALDEAEVLKRLEVARAEFYEVEMQITKFRKSHQGASNGNRTAAA
jgi:hypothetical protein